MSKTDVENFGGVAKNVENLTKFGLDRNRSVLCQRPADHAAADLPYRRDGRASPRAPAGLATVADAVSPKTQLS
jgi:hypothetical protein